MNDISPDANLFDDLAGRECPDCGSQLERDWRCPSCGDYWDELAEEEETEEEEAEELDE